MLNRIIFSDVAWMSFTKSDEALVLLAPRPSPKFARACPLEHRHDSAWIFSCDESGSTVSGRSCPGALGKHPMTRLFER